MIAETIAHINSELVSDIFGICNKFKATKDDNIFITIILKVFIALPSNILPFPHKNPMKKSSVKGTIVLNC